MVYNDITAKGLRIIQPVGGPESMSERIRRLLGCMALALACVMIGAAMTHTLTIPANAETLPTGEVVTVVHTSPFTQAIAQVRDSVVGVSNYQTVTYGGYGYGYGFGFGYGYGNRQQTPESREELAATGSGVVIGDGFVLTNFHVVEDASSLRVTVTDDAGETTEYAASLVTYDEVLDAAILYAPECPLPPVTLGDSDTLLVGDWAICIGNPLGFAKTTTVGVVSALNRAIESDTYDKYGRRATISNAMIQVDAAINSGNSGGGMFSVTGELMGIPTLKYSGSYYSGTSIEGIGMCIPVNAVKPMIDDVLSGRIQPIAPESNTEGSDVDSINLTGKPRLGVSIADVNTSSRAARLGQIPDGVFITNVEAGSPAEAAGMQIGDIIVDVNGVVITSTSQLQSEIGKYAAGDVLAIKVYRAPGILDISGNDNAPDGDYVDLKVTLAVIDEILQ